MPEPSTKVPNPRRVAAGKLNNLKRGPLTEAGRERMRQSALAHRPWEHTTGPKTEAGKARSSQNSKLRQKGPLSFRGKIAELAEEWALMKSMAALRAGILSG